MILFAIFAKYRKLSEKNSIKSFEKEKGTNALSI